MAFSVIYLFSGNKTNAAASQKGDAGSKSKANSNAAKNEAKELQALAFGVPSKKKSNKKKSGKSSGKDSGDQKQFEQWKVKDEEVKLFMTREAISKAASCLVSITLNIKFCINLQP